MNEKDLENVPQGRVLAIDDSKLNLHALNQMLGDIYTVKCVSNPADGLAEVKSFKPDLILLDVVMPQMSGFDVITLIKEDEETRDIPVIFLTGLSDRKNELLGLSLGAVDYIKKPFDAHTVILRVKTQFKIINLLRELYTLSVTDHLTGLGNRRHFSKVLEAEWKRSSRSKRPLGFIISDIDHFKKFNDTFGHLSGDLVLRDVAKVIKESAKRVTDHVARWGGEEFAIILPDTDISGAFFVAEKVRAEVEKTTFRVENDVEVNVTISMGVNSVVVDSDSDFTVEKFLSETDDALYKAKELGRNRVFPVGLH